MNILLTNDDGVAAPGIWAAARTLACMGQVTVVAPATNYSGYGAALPPARSFSYFPYRHADGHPNNVIAYGLAGTPATCAHVGLSGVFGGGPFDLVVSGINHGDQPGPRCLLLRHSGRGADCAPAGRPGDRHLPRCRPGRGGALGRARPGRSVRSYACGRQNPEPTPVVFNVNVPNLPVSHLEGTLITSPANASCLTKYRFSPDPHAENTLSVIAHDDGKLAPEPWTDAWAVELGYVAITPFRAVPDLLCVIPWVCPVRSRRVADAFGA